VGHSELDYRQLWSVLEASAYPALPYKGHTLLYLHLQGKEKRVRKAFRKPDELPKILIVTEKLLTGFDAPILYCMYLDKPMRDHVLLQAIARVNRPYGDDEGRKKPSGFVLDFVGIFGNLEKALAFDSADIEGVVKDIQLLKKRFSQLIEEAREQYLTLIKGKTRDKAVEAILEQFKDEQTRQAYYKFYREVADIYEIISPDAFLRPYLEEYETLTDMYGILRAAYEPSIGVDKEFLRKTAKLVQEHTRSGKIKAGLDIYEINETTLELLEKKAASKTEKVFNLLVSIRKATQKEGLESPYLISIGDKAERRAQLFKEGQKTTQYLLDELKKLIDEINAARKEQAERQLPPDVFSILWLMQQEGVKEVEGKAKQMGKVIEQYPHWKTSAKHERNFRQEFYKVLLQSGLEVEKVTEVVKGTMRALKGGAE